MVAHCQQILVTFFRRSTFAILSVFSKSDNFDGIRIWMMAETEDTNEVFTRIRVALELLEAVDQVRFRRTKRYLKRIVVYDHSGAGYLPEINACMLGVTFLSSAPPARLAANIIHEATHARFRRAGIALTPAIRAREEAACVRESLFFLGKFEEGATEARRLRDLVAREIDSGNPWYSDERRSAKVLADLERAGFPPAILRFLRREA
jgi:hypothetical protein